MAVVLGQRRHRRRRGSTLASVPAPFRSRTHLPAVQTDPGLDRPEDPHSASSRPVDVAGHRRLHPAASRPPARRRPAPTLGETGPAGSADTGPGPPRGSKPPPTHHPARQRSETLPTRSRTPTRIQERHTGNPPRRRKDHHTRPHHDRAPQAHRLKIKLSWGGGAGGG